MSQFSPYHLPDNTVYLFQREGIYVRLSGFMKSFGNKKYVKASYMRPITDFNEIYFHLLECITVTLTLERGPVSVLLTFVTCTHNSDFVSRRVALEPDNKKLLVADPQPTRPTPALWTLGMNTLTYLPYINKS